MQQQQHCPPPSARALQKRSPPLSSGFPFHRSFMQATPFPDKIITKACYSTWEWQMQHCQDYRETAPGLMSLEMGWAQSLGGKCLSLITVISEWSSCWERNRDLILQMGKKGKYRWNIINKCHAPNLCISHVHTSDKGHLVIETHIFYHVTQ